MGAPLQTHWWSFLRVSRSIAPLILAVVLTAGLVSCSADADEKPRASSTPKASASASSEPTSTPEAEETEAAAAPAGDATAASWAAPVTTAGELIGSVDGPNFKVDMYQVGTTAATKTGNFVNPDTNLPIIAVGDEIVFVNYVVTNTSSETIPLSSLLVDVSTRYDDWPYMQGMDAVTDSALYETMGVNSNALAEFDPAPYAFEPGNSYSVGENFRYQAGSPLTFIASLTPSDDAGNLMHDLRAEVTGTATIK
jgi:hypothetical protein